ncbi:Fe-S cluster assembly ATPase SufC [Candidatus Dependentiae bacterium]|nr:Fe-S cluster assembly ATPase SufC [Candidatus Dependentiae bacterium]
MKVELSHLSVVFKDNDTLLLKDISLVLESGTIHALMGPNGSGKSSLAATLMGYPHYQVIEGLILYDGQDLAALSIEQRARAGIFLACQYPPIIPGVEVFTFLKEAHRMLTGQDVSVKAFKELLYQALDAVKLDHSFAYRKVNEGFSGGEKKRLELAQLLLFRPRFAILDEIDSGLDIDALMNITEIIAQEQKITGMTLLIITHYNRVLEYIQPDHVHILYKGRIAVSGEQSIARAVEKRGYDELLF